MTLGPETLGGAPKPTTILSQSLDHIHTIKTTCHGMAHAFGRLSSVLRRGGLTALMVRGEILENLTILVSLLAAR
jgi:hypothetical protein